MNKAILVIDMPENCGDCAILFQDGYSDWCPWENAVTDVYNYAKNGTKPDWCPLQPMPDKYDIPDSDFEYELGFNRCIDWILGGEK